MYDHLPESERAAANRNFTTKMEKGLRDAQRRQEEAQNAPTPVARVCVIAGGTRLILAK